MKKLASMHFCDDMLLYVKSKKIEKTNFGNKNHVLMTLDLFWIEIMKLKLPEKLRFVLQFVWCVWIIDLFMLLKGLHTYLTWGFRVGCAAKKIVTLMLKLLTIFFQYQKWKMYEITKLYFWIFVESWNLIYLKLYTLSFVSTKSFVIYQKAANK